jgi:hypothetical protein
MSSFVNGKNCFVFIPFTKVEVVKMRRKFNKRYLGSPSFGIPDHCRSESANTSCVIKVLRLQTRTVNRRYTVPPQCRVVCVPFLIF